MIAFLYNPTSWVDGPVPGGMADALIRPILPHLDGHPYQLVNTPKRHAVNVYYAHRSKYGGRLEPGVRSVFVSHGIADKAWRHAGRVKSQFDVIVVSGPTWTRKLLGEGMPATRIIEAGYTKLDPIFNGELPEPERDGRLRVVWAPTHGGGGEAALRRGTPPRTLGASVTTWWKRDEILALLPESEFDVIPAPHPRHRPDRKATLEEYVGADVVIADGGSTIYEAWALGLPVVFCDWLTGRANCVRHGSATFEAHIYRERLGYHAQEPADLPVLVAQAAQAGIGQRAAEFIEGIFPAEYRGTSGRRHAEALLDIAHDRPLRHLAHTVTHVFRNPRSGRVRRAVVGTNTERQLARQSGIWEKVGVEE